MNNYERERDAVRRLGGRVPFPWREAALAVALVPIIVIEEHAEVVLLFAVSFLLLWVLA